MAHKYIVWIALITATSHANRDYNHQITFQEEESSPDFKRFFHQFYEEYPEVRYPVNDRPSRANERSLPVNSDLQRVQEEEKRRLDSRRADSSVRNENGSYKIVNTSKTRNHPVLSNRNGETHESLVRAKDEVIFPEPNGPSFIPEITEECKKFGICENITNYPHEHVNRIIDSLKIAKYELNKDELHIEITQRLGTPADHPLCDVLERIAIPLALENEHGVWKFIVNKKNEKALQIFRVEICSKQMGPCNSTYANFRTHETYCKQKYVYRSMLALDTNTGEVIPEFFRLPSCCSCFIKD